MTHSQTVRLNRKQCALSQRELGILLALSQGEVSRLEEHAESTKLETALGLQVVFDVQPRELFARAYAKVEDEVMRRAARLDRQFRKCGDAGVVRKHQTLVAMVKRAKPAKEV